jgi:hypothetical protein
MVTCISPLIRAELSCLPCHASPMLPGMFIVSEAEAAAIRTAYEQSGELAAAVELRRLFPCITDNAKARECARTNLLRFVIYMIAVY